MKYITPVCDFKEFRAGYKAHKDRYQEQQFSIIIDRFIEEAAELTKELLKWKRGAKERHGKPIDEVIKDEFSDCLLTLEFIAYSKGFTFEEIKQRMLIKSNKLINSMKELKF
jgi:NTP pyrophosphatase (non-canonical NTP hydrolase)